MRMDLQRLLLEMMWLPEGSLEAEQTLVGCCRR